MTFGVHRSSWFPSSMMYRVAVLILLFSSGMSLRTGAAEELPERFDETWSRLLNTQLDAADAEVRLWQAELQFVQQLHRDGRAAATDVQHCRYRAEQAARWETILRQQQGQISRPGDSSQDPQMAAQLRVPGISLAFVDDEFAFVAVTDTPQSRSILGQIRELLSEQQQTSSALVRQRALADQMSRMTAGAPQTAEHQRQQEHFELQRSAILFDPMQLEAALLRPVLWHEVATQQLSDGDTPSGLWTQSARSWVRASRLLLMEQANPQTDPQLTEPADGSVAAEPATTAGRVMNASESVIRQLEQELNLVGRSDDVSSETELRPEQRLAVLMKLSKDSWDVVQQKLTDIREEIQTIAARIAQVSATAEETDDQSPERELLQEQADVAAAVAQQLAGELERRRASIRYAMALYRLETGKDSDSATVRQERRNVFAQAARLQPDRQLIELRSELARRQLERLQAMPSRGPAAEAELRQLTVELQVLKAEQRRLEIRMSVAGLCLKLLKLTDAEPAVALQKWQIDRGQQ